MLSLQSKYCTARPERDRPSKLPPEWVERARLQLGEEPDLVPRIVQELRDRLQGDRESTVEGLSKSRFQPRLDVSASRLARIIHNPGTVKSPLKSEKAKDYTRAILNDAGLKDVHLMGDSFYLAFLRARKFHVEKTIKLLRRYCDMRLRFPEVCRFAPVDQNRRFHDTRAITVIQDRNHFDGILIMVKIEYFDLRHVTAMYVLRQYYTLLETCVLDPLTQIGGVHLVLDLAGISFKHVRMMSPTFVSSAVSLTQDSFPLRCKGVHVLNQPFGFEAIYSLFKPFLSEKLRKRVRVYGTDWTSLHQNVPREVLPNFYGGSLQGIDNEPWLMRLREVEQSLTGQ